MVISDIPHYQSDWTPPTTELLAIMIGMENMRLQSRIDLSLEHLLTIYDHLHVCSQSLRSAYIIYRYHCHVQQTGALGTKFIKMEEKHLFWKCQLIPCNWGKNLSLFFTVYNFNSITATEHPLHQLQLLLKKCEPVLHTLNRGFVMKHAWSLTMYTQQFWNLLLLLACWKRFH